MEYIIFDSNFLIVKYSPKVKFFLPGERTFVKGEDIRNYYSEIRGVEKNILESEEIGFKISRVKRHIGQKYIYFDLLFVKNGGKKAQDLKIFMLFEDRSSSILFERKIDRLDRENKFLKNKIIAKDSGIKKVIDSVSDLLIVINELGTIEQINQPALKLLGYNTSELVGKHISRIFVEDRYSQNITSYLEEDRANTPQEIICQTKQGRQICLSFSFSCVRSAISSNLNLVCIGRDITFDRQIYERDRLLRLIDQQINQSLNLTAIFQTTTKEIRNLLNCDRIIIYRCLPPQADKIIVEMVKDPADTLTEHDNYRHFITSYLQKNFQREIQVIEDTYSANLESEYRDCLLEFSIRAKVIVPLYQSGRLWGAISIQQLHRSRQWQKWELDLLQELKEKLAIAIQQSELHQQLEALATTDELTGLANLRCLNSCLHHEWYRLARQQQYLALIIADVDCFKAYNDCYGRLAGDNCLQTIANILLEVINRPADLIARHGEEKFIVVLPNTNLQGAEYLARKICDRVQEARIPHQKSAVSSHISLSIGIACQIPQVNSTYQKLIQQANKALHQAKQQGCNLICF